jgi:hypothetical protein
MRLLRHYSTLYVKFFKTYKTWNTCFNLYKFDAAWFKKYIIVIVTWKRYKPFDFPLPLEAEAVGAGAASRRGSGYIQKVRLRLRHSGRSYKPIYSI